jgi:tRNA(adenine34) deaminase
MNADRTKKQHQENPDQVANYSHATNLQIVECVVEDRKIRSRKHFNAAYKGYFRRMENDERYMKEALAEARKALATDEVPIGCIVVWKERIIARAFNRTEQLKDFTAHAEMQAFTSASEFLGNKYLNECTLYVTLEPCVMCSGAAFWTQLGRIVYGAKDIKRGISGFSNRILHPSTEIIGGILETDCAELLTHFFKQKRNKR